MSPLLEPQSVPAADTLGRVHFVAAGGAGMSGIAKLYAERGIDVSGSDQEDSVALRRLADAGVTTHVGHDAAHLGTAQAVIRSTAVRDDNPEIVEAQRRGVPVWHRSMALAALMSDTLAVSVSGTHGKTTTSAMVATMLTAAGGDPSYVIGAPLQASGSSAHLGTGDVFVVEADESDGSFRQYPTKIAVITNIEADHLDNWETPQAYERGFLDFAAADLVEQVVLDADDPGCQRLKVSLRDRGKSVVTAGEAADADIRITDIVPRPDGITAQVTYAGTSGVLRLQVPGLHNLHNAALAYAVGRVLGYDSQGLLAGAAQFSGTERRFQTVGEAAGVTVVDDYAHHPTEVAATLVAARTVLTAGGRLVVAFQPHLFTRTRDFAAEFGSALAAADVVVVTDIYPAREDPIPGVSGRLVADAVAAAGAEVHYVATLADVAQALAALVRPGDLVLTLGAGSITEVGPRVVELLETGHG